MVRISNLKLLKLLSENGRLSYSSLAKIFGVSEAAIRKRVKKLIDEGVIKKFTIVVDYTKVGLINTIIGIDTLPEKYVEICEKLKNAKEVNELYYSTGDHSIMIMATFKSNKELHKFVKKLERMKGVKRVCPAIIIERVK